MAATGTSGQFEAAVGGIVNQFLRDLVGRGANTVSAVRHRDLLVVRLGGVLTKLEESLSLDDAEEESRTLARAIRHRLVTRSRQRLVATLASATGSSPAAILHDCDDRSGEEVFVFRFAEGDGPPRRDARSG